LGLGDARAERSGNLFAEERVPLFSGKSLLACGLSLVFSTPELSAQSTNTYNYDARGRLTAFRDGLGAKSDYAFDKVDNRASLAAQKQFSTAWEAEVLPHQVGFADTGGWAANVNTPTGAIVYGPYSSTTPVGSRVATVRALVDVVNASDATIIYMDVYDATAAEQIAGLHIKRKDWLAPMSYQVFELPFEWPASRAGHLIEIRAWYNGYAYTRVDKVGFF
jgi:YD repeat-containing protein